jgi:hypothetical protein
MSLLPKQRDSFEPGKKNGSTIDKWVYRWYGCLDAEVVSILSRGFFGRKGIFNNGVE